MADALSFNTVLLKIHQNRNQVPTTTRTTETRNSIASFLHYGLICIQRHEDGTFPIWTQTPWLGPKKKKKEKLIKTRFFKALKGFLYSESVWTLQSRFTCIILRRTTCIMQYFGFSRVTFSCITKQRTGILQVYQLILSQLLLPVLSEQRKFWVDCL